ncbi:MAG TPA: Gfo/Idh/MocA family oxidoreductase [Saprospiraceae bacterium]|nr:Gfo/Idh/MocA family oxidoreductase [Saprospiraceae bacterium]HMQ81970.1 Gfo/Idh/MocA family oxidoreductase [Saprospiraceae bacterium]
MTDIINWGIVGPGKIAHKFAQDLATLPNARLHAVASRDHARADAFARQYGAPFAYGSYEAMLECPDLDVVYIASPHSSHYEHTLLFLEKGIPVLCEKPFAMNGQQVKAMIAAARSSNTFLMEALWTRFLPTTAQMLRLISGDMIGKVYTVKADFGFQAPFDPESRLYDPALGGGALLDIGIYPVFLALFILGRPDQIKAIAHLGTTGVDEETGILFHYQDGRMAHLHASIRARTKTEAFIYGEKGVIHLHTRWHEPTNMSLLHADGRMEYFPFQWNNNGYAYEAEEVMHCLKYDLKESPLWPLASSLELTEVLDTIRQEIGLKYAWDEY